MTEPTFKKGLQYHIANSTPTEQRTAPPRFSFYIAVFFAVLALTLAADILRSVG